jgi:hypothetical protein
MRDFGSRCAEFRAGMSTLVCTQSGVFVWPGVPLVERRGGTFVRMPDRDICNLVASLHGPSVVGSRLIPVLDAAARLLTAGSIEKANAAIAGLDLPPLSATGRALLGSDLTGVAPGFFAPEKHPRWPSGQPDGGRFKPADGAEILPVADQQEPKERPTKTKEPSKVDEIPELPKDRLPTKSELNRFGRLQSANIRARIAGRLPGIAGAAQLLAELPEIARNAQDIYSRIVSRLDEPMTLDELINRTYSDSPPKWPAYEAHHIVEQTPNKNTIPKDQIEARENVVKIPYYIHRDISDWYSTPNEKYDGKTPREYLRGKSFEEQYQFGLDVLRDRGVLK